MPIIVTPTPTGDAFSDLLTEFYERGFDYLNDGANGTARAKRWINQSIHELCEMAQWPFLQVTATGTAPMELGDVRRVVTVVNTATLTELDGLPREQLIEDMGRDLGLTGWPQYWYLENQTLSIYPVSSDTLSVRYVFIPTDLDTDADVCVVPKRYSNIVIDLAVGRGLTDSDNLMAAYAIKSGVQDQVQSMMENLLWRGETGHTRVVGYSEDW